MILVIIIIYSGKIYANSLNSFSVSPLFNDNMVIQRDKPIKIWGSGETGSNITIKLNDIEAKTVVQNGEWFVELPPMDSNLKCSLEIQSDNPKDEKLIINNVAIGEVWIAGGQSNMEFRLKDDIEASQVIPISTNENIRFFDCPKLEFENQKDFKNLAYSGVWKASNPDNSPYFSAVSYYYAQMLYQSLNVPIGIISCNLENTSASEWLDESYLKNNQKLKIYLDRYNQKLSSLGISDLNSLSIAEIESFGNELKHRPAGLYNTMVKKIVPYSVKGVIWYQGESDTSNPYLYSELFSNVIKCWRDSFNDELPFLFVQLAPLKECYEFSGSNFPIIRERQDYVSKTVPNTYMVSIMDLGMEYEVHPNNKRQVGERLSLLACGKVYNKDVLCEPPEFESAIRSGDSITLKFKNVGDELYIKSKDLNNLQVKVNNSTLINYKVEIDKDFIKIYSPYFRSKNSKVEIKFAWTDYAEVNLYNSVNLPAKPFKLFM